MDENKRKLLWACASNNVQGTGTKPRLVQAMTAWIQRPRAKVCGPVTGSSESYSPGLCPSYWVRGIVLRDSRSQIQTLGESSEQKPV